MQRFATLLLFASFLAASLVAVLDLTRVDWPLFSPLILSGTIAVVMLKRAQKADARADATVHGNLERMAGSLQSIHSQLLELKSTPLPPYEYRFEIDRRFREELFSFAEARESMIHHFGLNAYADIMSAFAAGERYINRVWSASTDGYIDEVRNYLDRAEAQFAEAREHFQGHLQRAEAQAKS